MKDPIRSINTDKYPYAQQEKLLSTQSEEFLRMLTDRGILEDVRIDDLMIRKINQAKKRNMYHNTEMMLKHYRDVLWIMECFPADIAAELDRPMHDLDALLRTVDAEIGMNNLKLESRIQSVHKSRLLVDRINEAISVLRQKPRNGELMYKIIYETYVSRTYHTILEILSLLGISERHYYRLRVQAINILSIRLWATPSVELDSWLEVLTMLELI